MRLFKVFLSSFITLILVYALSRSWGDAIPMALGHFVSPQHGFWQNAEPYDHDFGEKLIVDGVKGKVDIFLDERLVPHVFAENDEDLYFTQGYLHARFRLFQMDLQTRAAAGRASEIAGPKAITYDREQRRLGMVYAAENALKMIENDPLSLQIFNAYTNGINAYIRSLKPSDWPLEYKLLNAEPEEWNNLRSALLLKMMAKMLAGGTENDLGYTRAKAIFNADELNILYPQVPDSLHPIIPKGTPFAPPGITPVAPGTADSLYFNNKTLSALEESYPADHRNGSNNWVVAGSKTASGGPILCNDPHLELSLPSIWYEIQLSAPSSNTYGVSLPGVPFVIIGFNNDVAWGVTNAQRDVKDYFTIRFRDETKKEYWYNNEWQPTELKLERINIKGQEPVYDTVAYTVFGPVMFDRSFQNAASGEQNLAVKWIAHAPSNEGLAFYHLNRARNYADYEKAISLYDCPGQNFIFASRSGDIAIWQQGKFPARWEGQGVYVMPGQDDTYDWQGFIPQKENPHSLNPSQGFLQSANQRPVDKSYPYFIPGSYITARGTAISEKLDKMQNIRTDDMKQLLYDYHNVEARYVRPVLLQHIKTDELDDNEKKHLTAFRNWDLNATPESTGQTIYQCWVDTLNKVIFADEMQQSFPSAPMPRLETMIELLIKDSTSHFYDQMHTPTVETRADAITNAFKRACVRLNTAEKEGVLEWAKFKKPTIYHLLKEAVPALAHENLHVGGYNNTINAMTKSHGPSWRMIVELGKETEAYGVYPAGQNGNPGSRFYDDFIETWERGDLYRLWFMKSTSDKTDSRVKWTMQLQP